jgi:hypothetical protein
MDFLIQNSCFSQVRHGNVNSQNNRYWYSENTHAVHEVPLHDLNVGVWCAVSVHKIVGPVFVREQTNNSHNEAF